MTNSLEEKVQESVSDDWVKVKTVSKVLQHGTISVVYANDSVD